MIANRVLDECLPSLLGPMRKPSFVGRGFSRDMQQCKKKGLQPLKCPG